MSTILKIGAVTMGGALVALAAVKLLAGRGTSQVPPAIEALSSEIVDLMDGEGPDYSVLECMEEENRGEAPPLVEGGYHPVGEFGIIRRVRQDRHNNFVAAVANAIKAEIGTPNPTAANFMVVSRLVAKATEALNLRNADRARVLPLVRAAVFAPTQLDIAEKQMYASLKVRRNLERVRKAYSGEKSFWRRLLGIREPEDEGGGPLSFPK